MAKHEKTKILSFVLSAVIIVVSLLDIDFSHYALSPLNSPFGNIAYHFFHVNILHAIVNVWCLLGIVFFYKIRVRDFIIAFAVAASFPTQLCIAPSVGLSGMLYALMGLIMPQVYSRTYFIACLVLWNVVAWIVGGFGVEVHAYCFVVALLDWSLYKCNFKL